MSAGDRAFNLSELTNQSRYGRGIGVEVTPPDWAWAGGIFYVEDRFLPTSRQDYGSWLAWQPAWLPQAAGRQPGQLRLNLLQLDEGASGRREGFRETLASLETRLSLRTRDRLEAEWAASRSTQPGRGDDQAWRLAYTGQGGPFSSYRVQARRAGPDYAGREADTADYGVGFTVPLHARLTGQFDVQRYERNLAAAPERGPRQPRKPLPRRPRFSVRHRLVLLLPLPALRPRRRPPHHRPPAPRAGPQPRRLQRARRP